MIGTGIGRPGACHRDRLPVGHFDDSGSDGHGESPPGPGLLIGHRDDSKIAVLDTYSDVGIGILNKMLQHTVAVS